MTLEGIKYNAHCHRGFHGSRTYKRTPRCNGDGNSTIKTVVHLSIQSNGVVNASL